MKKAWVFMLLHLCAYIPGYSQPVEFGTTLDPFYNLKEQKATVFAEIAPLYGANPTVELFTLEPGFTLEKNIQDNLDFLRARGFTTVSFPVLDGFGMVFVDVPILRGMVHAGFDYDSQLANPSDPESELRDGLDETSALQRYVVIADLAPFAATEATKRGMSVDLNVESLAHIANRASGAGIGGSADEVIIAGNLPPLTPAQVAQFLVELNDAVMARDPSIAGYSVFEEAFSDDYVAAIEETTERLGIRHRKNGESSKGYADIWAGYYYAFYPLTPLQETIYRFLITIASTPAVTAQTFGAARAAKIQPQLVVGHYTPWPADTSLGIEDLYNPNRPDNQPPISAEEPLTQNGEAVKTRTSGLQNNFLLYGMIAERVRNYFISVDLTPALADLPSINLDSGIKSVMDEFAFVMDEDRPIVNVIIDLPVDQGNDLAAGNEISDFSGIASEVIFYSAAEPIYAAIHAAGMEPWVTFNQPLEGREAAAYWIVTAGGSEWIEEEEAAEAPPFWTSADELDDALLALLDPAQNSTPAILSTLAGLPNTGNWARVREVFGIPPGRGGTELGPAFASSNGIEFPGYQTSLATNILIDNNGEILTDESGDSKTANLLPETIKWEGHDVKLRGFDPARFGVVCNVISPKEVEPQHIVLASSNPEGLDQLFIHDPNEDGSAIETRRQATVFIFKDAVSNNKRWINPNIYHVDMMHPLSNLLCDITGRARIMNQPSLAYLFGGETTAAFAITKTSLDLTLPIENEMVAVNKFDAAGNRVVSNQIVAKDGLFPFELERHELAIFSSPGSAIEHWNGY